MDKDGKNKGGRHQGQGDFRKLLHGHLPPVEAAILTNRFIVGMSLADAALAAGCNCSNRQSAAARAAKVVAKHRGTNGELMTALARVGVSADRLAEVIARGLEAAESVRVGDNLFEDRPDHKTRHRFLETCLDIMGAKAAQKVSATPEPTFEQRLLAIIAADETSGRVQIPD